MVWIARMGKSTVNSALKKRLHAAVVGRDTPTANLQRATRLRQSILPKAFTGNLA